MPAALRGSDYHVELINGRELPKPLPKRLHWIVQARVFRELLKWEGALNVEVGTEVEMLAGSGSTERLIPDVAVVAKDGQYRDGILIGGALLAVEIISPGQTVGHLFDKCEMLHASGTRYCWVLWPQKRGLGVCGGLAADASNGNAARKRYRNSGDAFVCRPTRRSGVRRFTAPTRDAPKQRSAR